MDNNSHRKIRVCDDVIYYQNMPAARVVLAAGPTRDSFESAIVGDKFSSLFRSAIMQRASGVAKAKTITLEELGQILDAVVGA